MKTFNHEHNNVHDYPAPRKYQEDSEYEGCAFEWAELEKVIKATGAKEIWYWYVTGSYCGNGVMILCIPEGYLYQGLDHCSCYGPLDWAEDKTSKCKKIYPSIKALLNDLSEGAVKELGEEMLRALKKMP